MDKMFFFYLELLKTLPWKQQMFKLHSKFQDWITRYYLVLLSFAQDRLGQISVYMQ